MKKNLKRKTIGLLTSFTPEIFKSEYHSRILAGIIDELRQTQYDVKFIMVKDEEYAESSLEIILAKYDVDGLLLLTWRIHPRYIEEAHGASDLPVVIINDYTPELKANIIYCENKMGVELALGHLVNRGYKKIGMLQGPDEFSLDARERFLLFESMIKNYDIDFDERFFRKCEYFFEEDGYLKMTDIIQNESELPRAIVCFNDDLAIGALKALKESWISCPEQVAVIGYDGVEKGKYTNPPLTTVRQPLEKMGREMVRTVQGLIEGTLQPPVQIKFSPNLVIRQSC